MRKFFVAMLVILSLVKVTGQEEAKTNPDLDRIEKLLQDMASTQIQDKSEISTLKAEIEALKKRPTSAPLSKEEQLKRNTDNFQAAKDLIKPVCDKIKAKWQVTLVNGTMSYSCIGS